MTSKEQTCLGEIAKTIRRQSELEDQQRSVMQDALDCAKRSEDAGADANSQNLNFRGLWYPWPTRFADLPRKRPPRSYPGADALSYGFIPDEKSGSFFLPAISNGQTSATALATLATDCLTGVGNPENPHCLPTGRRQAKAKRRTSKAETRHSKAVQFSSVASQRPAEKVGASKRKGKTVESSTSRRQRRTSKGNVGPPTCVSESLTARSVRRVNRSLEKAKRTNRRSGKRKSHQRSSQRKVSSIVTAEQSPEKADLQLSQEAAQTSGVAVTATTVLDEISLSTTSDTSRWDSQQHECSPLDSEGASTAMAAQSPLGKPTRTVVTTDNPTDGCDTLCASRELAERAQGRSQSEEITLLDLDNDALFNEGNLALSQNEPETLILPLNEERRSVTRCDHNYCLPIDQEKTADRHIHKGSSQLMVATATTNCNNPPWDLAMNSADEGGKDFSPKLFDNGLPQGLLLNEAASKDHFTDDIDQLRGATGYAEPGVTYPLWQSQLLPGIANQESLLKRMHCSAANVGVTTISNPMLAQLLQGYINSMTSSLINHEQLSSLMSTLYKKGQLDSALLPCPAPSQVNNLQTISATCLRKEL